MGRLQYRLPIWDREKEASDGKPGRRTAILALVVYNGKVPWTAPLSLPGMVDPELHGTVSGDPALQSELCSVGYLLLDIGRMREDRLGNDPDLKGGLLTLGHAYRGPVDSRVLHRIRELISEGTTLEEQTYQYILAAFDTDRDTILAAFETKGAKTVEFLAHSVVGKAHAEGEAKGRSEGEAMGRASLLSRLLEHRFGRLPARVRERVRSASVQDLDAWGDAVLDAPTLEAVFEDTPRL